MADCPNCGRQTLRTKDWACQWCGYPLISKSFKVIDKTYKELQEERNLASKSATSEEETELTERYESEPEEPPEQRPEPTARPVFKPQPKVTKARPSPTPPPEPEPVYEAEPSPQPVSEPEAEPVNEAEPSPEPVQEPGPVYETEPSSEPEPESIPEAEQTVESSPLPQDESAPEPAPRVVPPPPKKPELIIEPEPIPEPTIQLADIQDGTEITVEQIDTLFRLEKNSANSAFTDKTLIIRGAVERVFIKDQLDIRYIMLASKRQKMTWGLRCTFNKEESSKISRVQEGQEVAVEGKYDGYSKNIIFKDCVLI
jgi:hypothetical protein